MSTPSAAERKQEDGAGTWASAARVPISVLIPTRNEEENIGKCLETVSWADEIYVVDSHSTDRTAGIAREHGAKVLEFTWDGKGPRKRNWALENLAWKHEWLLLLDADEEVTPALREEITRVVQKATACVGFLIRYHYYFLGRMLRHGDPLWKLGLVRHRLARFERIEVPEVTAYDVEVHEWPRLEGPLGRLHSPIIHRDFADLHHHFGRHNIYSDWEALLRTRYGNRERTSEVQARLFGSAVERRRFLKRLFLSLPGKPWIYFFYSYVLRGGFLDGRPGFIYNVLKSFYWYQVSLKEYEIQLGACPQRDPPTRQEDPIRQRQEQVRFYRELVDAEEEITRPGCYPRPVRYLLDFKLRSALALLRRYAPADGLRGKEVLVVCCGSGMEAEFLGRQGMKVVALDISLAAVKRAKERARRYGGQYQLVVGDAENLPFRADSIEIVFVHDGMHHLPDPYRGIREMIRVASHVVIVAEPADAFLTKIAVKLGIAGEYEEAGNYVYRLSPRKLVQVFQEEGMRKWVLRRDLIYYQPWTFRVYKLFVPGPLSWLFRAGFHLANSLLGRWGNSLKAAAWKEDALAGMK